MKPSISACQDGGPLHHPHGLPHKHLELELDRLSIKAQAGDHTIKRPDFGFRQSGPCSGDSVYQPWDSGRWPHLWEPRLLHCDGPKLTVLIEWRRRGLESAVLKGRPSAAMIINIRSTIISTTLVAAGPGRREMFGEKVHLVFLSFVDTGVRLLSFQSKQVE